MTVSTSVRGLRADAARNVERIIDAAQRVFARAGSAAVMEDVAAEAGVGVATVYRRFPTKKCFSGRFWIAASMSFWGLPATPNTRPIRVLRCT